MADGHHVVNRNIAVTAQRFYWRRWYLPRRLTVMSRLSPTRYPHGSSSGSLAPYIVTHTHTHTHTVGTICEIL